MDNHILSHQFHTLCVLQVHLALADKPLLCRLLFLMCTNIDWKKMLLFFFVFVFQSMFSMWTILGVKSHLHVTYKLYPQLLWLMSITQYQCLHNFIGICLFSCSAFSNVLFYYLCVESRFDVILWFWNIVFFFFFWVMLEPYLSFSWII